MTLENGTNGRGNGIDWQSSFITPEWIERAGIYRVDHLTGAEKVGKKPKAGEYYQGVIIPYFLPGESHPREFRLRRDIPDYEQEQDGSRKEKNKYLTPPGRSNMAYFPPGIEPEWLSDPTVDAIIVEGEKKAIAIRRYCVETGKDILVIALPGVWNFRGKVGIETGPHGERVNVKGVIADIERVVWTGRRVQILFDTNAVSNPSVNAARRELARQLIKRGAFVKLLDIPEQEGVNGPDDFLGKNGPDAFTSFLSETHAEQVDRASEIKNAVNLLQSIYPKLSESPKPIFEADALRALALLKYMAPGDYAEIRAHLGQYKIPLRQLDAELKKHQPTPEPLPQVDAPERQAGDFLPDAPIPTLIVPDGYKLESDKTLGQVPNTLGFLVMEPIAFGALLITGRTKDVDGENEGVRVSWKRGGPWRHKIVDRGVVANSRELVSLANSGFPVTSSDAKSQVEYFAKFEAANFAALPVARTASHLGWQGEGGELGFLVGRDFIATDGSAVEIQTRGDSMDWTNGAITFRGGGAGDEQIVGGYHCAGSLDKWIEAVEQVARFPRVLSTIYASFAAPLLQILGLPNFILDLSARTSQGKTTTQRAAASVWGDPDERKPSSSLQTWDITKVGVERVSAILNGIPLILDDTKRAKLPGIIAEVLYAVTSGRGRVRGSLTGLQTSKTWHTILISSGEQPVTSFTNDGGTRMRTLEIQGAPFGREDPETGKIVQLFNLAILSNYGHAGRRYVSWLMENLSERDEWKSEINRRAEEYIRTAPNDRAGRLAIYAATIAQAASLAHSALDLPWTFEDPLERLWAEISGEAEDAVGARRALRYLLSWAWANECRFIGREQENHKGVPVAPAAGWIGRWDRDEDYEFIAFYPHHVEDILRAQKFNPDAVLGEWRERGWLRVKGDGQSRFTDEHRLRGEIKRARLITVLRAGINAIDE